MLINFRLHVRDTLQLEALCRSRTAAALKCQSSIAMETPTRCRKSAREHTRTERQAVIGDNSGSTPGNPHIIDGEGPDIFQRMPNNIPLIQRSAKFLRGAAGTRKNSRESV